MKKAKNVHFVGIKGVGITPLAIIATEAGWNVTGSDIGEEFITDVCLKQAGITPLVGFSQSHVSGVDLVITTGAHGGFDNEEVLAAKRQNIPVLTQGEAVGRFMEGGLFGRKKMAGISVAGSHGKTTTTALIATLLMRAKKDPSYVIGTGLVPSLGLPGHFGKGNYFVAEADEYATEPVYDKKPKLLWQKPVIGVITNIELDHPDLYPTVDAMRVAFIQFAQAIPQHGVLVAYGDDVQTRKLLQNYSGRVITYGYNNTNDFRVMRSSNSIEHQFFWLQGHGADLGEFMIMLSGEHNILNATAAVIVALETGVGINEIKKLLPLYTGSRRRFQEIGRLKSGALVFDDYAHHPTEIKKTLQAFHQRFPGKKVVCIFQPHTYSRTKVLFDEFVHAFSEAQEVILMDIYPSLREQPDPTVSSEILASQVKRYKKNVRFLSSIGDVVEYIKQKDFNEDVVVVTMGAGDVYKIADHLSFS